MKRIKMLGLITLFLIAPLAAGQAETLVFWDDFSAGFGGRWTTGANTGLYAQPLVGVQAGRVQWTQAWDYIQTVQAFQEPFRVEVDLERTAGSSQCKDFAVEPAGLSGLSGALRLGYGSDRWHSINLGQEPLRNSRGAGFMGVCVRDGAGYMAEIPEVLPHKGTAMLTYRNGQVQFAFRNHNGQTIETPWKPAGSTGPRQIAIWASGAGRFVDAVRVYSLTGPDPKCAYLDMATLSIVIPCLTVGDVQFRLRLLFDPAVAGGIYFKLDESSLEPVH